MSFVLPPLPGIPVVPGAGDVVSGVASLAAGSVIGNIAQSFSSAAAWALDKVGSVFTSTTSIKLSAPWFGAHYEIIAWLAVSVAAPLAFIAAIQAVMRQDMTILLRSVLVNLPLALLATGIAVELTRLVIVAVDQMCNVITSGTHADIKELFSRMEQWFVVGLVAGPVPWVVALFAACVAIFGGLLLWMEMAVRTASIYIAVLFLPMALIGTAMPATIAWCKRMVETLAALILSKLVIVATLSLAVSAMGASGSGFGDVVEGCALLLMCSFAPFALLKLVPLVEAGAVHHLEGLAHRGLTAPVRMTLSTVNGVNSLLTLRNNIEDLTKRNNAEKESAASARINSVADIPLSRGTGAFKATERDLETGRSQGEER